MKPNHRPTDSCDIVQWSDKWTETRLNTDKKINDFSDNYAHDACKIVSRKRSHSYSGYQDPSYCNINCGVFGKKSDLKMSISPYEQPARPFSEISRESQPRSLLPPSAPPAQYDIHDEDGKGFTRNHVFNAVVLIIFLTSLVANGVMCYSIYSSKNEAGELQTSFTSKLGELRNWSENEIRELQSSVDNLNKSSQNKEIPKNSRISNHRDITAANRVLVKDDISYAPCGKDYIVKGIESSFNSEDDVRFSQKPPDTEFILLDIRGYDIHDTTFNFLECQRPSIGCRGRSFQYRSVDCDGDGVLDHVCRNTFSKNGWLVLSSEGCPNSWGTRPRSISVCVKAFAFKLGTAGTTTCPGGHNLVTDRKKCETSVRDFFKKELGTTGCWKFAATGCVYKHDRIFFNTCRHSNGTARHHRPVCE